ncbi:MAG: glycosyltransferase family 9 protein [Chromatiales bacterium]|nr:glycosyltransferase family 9 protein [Chromatiales bacterium]
MRPPRKPNWPPPESRPATPFIAVNPNASTMALARRWPEENFVTLLDRLEQAGLPAGRADRSARRGHAASNGCAWARVGPTGIANLAGRLSLAELIPVLRRAALLVTNDSGPLHLAGAPGVPTVSFFGPETPALFGPRGPRDIVLYRGIDCSPCISIYNAKTVRCMRGPARVPHRDHPRRGLRGRGTRPGGPVRVLLLNPPAATVAIRDYYCSKRTKSNYLFQPIDLLMQSGVLAPAHELFALDATAERMDPHRGADGSGEHPARSHSRTVGRGHRHRGRGVLSRTADPNRGADYHHRRGRAGRPARLAARPAVYRRRAAPLHFHRAARLA